MSQTANSARDRLFAVIKEYNREQANDKNVSISNQLKDFLDAFDGVGESGKDSLKSLFRKTLNQALFDRLNASMMQYAKQNTKIQSDIIGVDQARITPPSFKASLSAVKEFANKTIAQKNNNIHHQASIGKMINKKNLPESDSVIKDILVNLITACIKAGQSLSKQSKEQIQQQAIAVLKPPGLVHLCNELTIVICDSFLRDKIFNCNEKSVINLADDIAYLCYIIILGINPKSAANVKQTIREEMIACGFFEAHNHLIEAQTAQASLPGTTQNQSYAANQSYNPAIIPSVLYFQTQKTLSNIGSNSPSEASSVIASPEPSTHRINQTNSSVNGGIKQIKDQPRTCPCFW